MAQSTTNLGKIHVFPSETLYNQFKDIIADNDLALLKDDGAYIIAANLAQNGYVKFSNGLILQWGTVAYIIGGTSPSVTYPISFTAFNITALSKTRHKAGDGYLIGLLNTADSYTTNGFTTTQDLFATTGRGNSSVLHWISVGV